MINRRVFLSSVYMFWAVIGFLVSTIVSAQDSDYNKGVATNYQQAVDRFRQLALTAPQLDFAPQWRSWRSQRNKNINDHVVALSQSIKFLEQQANTLTLCQQVTVKNMAFQVALLQERYTLINRLPSDSPNYEGRFGQLPNGQLWYKHWLKSWLQSDVGIEELLAIAEQELNDVNIRRAQLVKMNLPDNTNTFKRRDEDKIINAFRQRENIVNQRLATFIAGNFRAPTVDIQEADLPKSFPAPGIYNPSNQTFLYHLHGDVMVEAHMDWLFLHEAVPGHHYHNQFSRSQSNCSQAIAGDMSSVFGEGWAAYVEQYGFQLGLFNDSASAAYVLDWQALRAVRVILDIGIHYYGWTDHQAQIEWMKRIPEQQAIMEREITRIKNWPVQVITYVYGKAVIQQMVSRIKSSDPSLSLPEIHQYILTNSNAGLSTMGLGLAAGLQENR